MSQTAATNPFKAPAATGQPIANDSDKNHVAANKTATGGTSEATPYGVDKATTHSTSETTPRGTSETTVCSANKVAAIAQEAEQSSPQTTAGGWRLLCWNVNGLRAVMKKGFLDFLREQDADVICLQEIKVTEAEAPKLEIPYPFQYYNSAAKKGYSGTATFSHHKPISVERPFDDDCPAFDADHPHEGRVLTLEFADFFLVNVYVPNSQDGLRRLDYRTNAFDRDFRTYLKSLGERKAVVVCGDFNVAHKEIDIARPSANRKSPGFTDEERASFSVHLDDVPLLDVFRHQHGDAPHQYTWWSYRGGARERNVGWRIDYFLVSHSASERALHSAILPDVLGSDHCPILLHWATQTTPA